MYLNKIMLILKNKLNSYKFEKYAINTKNRLKYALKAKISKLISIQILKYRILV